MAADSEQPRARAAREQARAGLAAAVARQASAGMAKMTPPALLAALSAGALAPLALAPPGEVALAGIGVAAGVGTNILSQVISGSLVVLRRRTGEPRPDEVERELYERIGQMLATGNAHGERLRAEIAAMLREIDAAGVALEVAIDSGNRVLQAQVAQAFAALSAEFAEFAFLLAGIDRAASAIQETLHRQDAEQRHDRDRMREQSTQLMLIREDLAILKQARREDADVTRWERGSPYRGLWPFEADHAPIFYGREQATARLVGKLAERLSGPGTVVVTGASGAGKSSLLRAGLLPALARGLLPVPGSEQWPRLLITPTRAPLDELATHLAALGAADPVAVRRALADHPHDTHLLVRQAMIASGSPDRARLVMVVDQFEEVFTSGETGQREAFISALTSAGTLPTGPDQQPRALIVVAVRGDLADRCAGYPALAEALQDGQFVVGPMTGPELRRVIAGPAAAAGLELESGLADAILDELGSRDGYGAGVLPLLSQAMLLTWENREGNRLTSRGYGLGGGIEHAVQTSADTVYDGLPPDRQVIARSVFHRMTLVSRDGQLARRRVSRTELYGQGDHADDVDAVLDAFTARRLIVLNDTTAEIAHDCLLQAWPRLRGWLSEDQAGHAVYGQLLDDARDWSDHGEDPSFLYQGARLTAVRQARAGWDADPGRYPPMGETAEEFLAASKHAAERAEQAATRRRRWARIGVAGLTALSLIASLASLAAVRSERTAEARHKDALSRQLAAQSISLTGTDVVVSGLLAAAAGHFAATDEARHAMLNALAMPIRGILDDATSVTFSPDGATLATTGHDGTVRLWDRATRKQVGSPLAGHTGSVHSVAFSPDGGTLATVGDDRTVRLWDRAGHKEVGSPLTGHSGPVHVVAFSPDGRTLATAGEDGARTWDLATHKQIGGVFRGDEETDAVAFSPDGKTVATFGFGPGTGLWDLATHERISPSPASHTREDVTAVGFSPDGRTLATGGDDGSVLLWDVAAHKPIGPPLAGHKGGVRALALSRTALAAADHDGRVRLWNLATHEPLGIPLTGQPSFVRSMAFSPDGATLATVGGDDTVRLWDAAGGKQAGTPLTDQVGAAYAVAFSPDRTTLATVGDDTVWLWDAATRKQRGALRGKTGYVTVLAFSRDGTTLATGGQDGVVRLWDVATREQAGTALTEHGGSVYDMSFTTDGKVLGTVDAGQDVRLWDIPTHKRIGRPLTGDSMRFADLVAFGPGGRTVAAAGREADGTVRLWDAVTREQLGGPFRHTGDVEVLAFSPDGTTLATGEVRDGALRSEGGPPADGGEGGLTGESTVRLWSLATRKQIGIPLGHAGFLTELAFSPDGKSLAGGSQDGSVRLWDLATYKQVGPPLTGSLTSSAFSPDGRTLATTGTNGARLWDVGPPRDPVSSICAIAGRPLTRQEWDQYLPGEPYEKICP
ncbi:AAA family ATPase [Planotetraspora sp. A-T 1434]|uniref:nSTAND1 domain-containing NTPase n=1 Tax=Planotetraspora sp. A-T 1434 TaxID=2979219 RepID=UPI0021C1107D|nr:AAA family ATPase [Planotetraspora sp. A-T 1434]MCT9931718.1 AAA family ATPase [Planotetraspora sp. A-T 1434]